MSCGVGRRCGSNLMLLWLWCRLVTVALIGPLAWEPPYATSVGLKKQKQKKKERKIRIYITKEEGGMDIELAASSTTSPPLRTLRGCLFACLFYGRICGVWKFLGQGSNLNHTCNPCHRFGNARSFNPLCQARNWTHPSTVTWATAVRFLTHYTRTGSPRTLGVSDQSSPLSCHHSPGFHCHLILDLND